MTDPTPPTMLTIKAAAELLNCTEAHLRDLVREHRVAALNIGTPERPNYRVSLADLLALRVRP